MHYVDVDRWNSFLKFWPPSMITLIFQGSSVFHFWKELTCWRAEFYSSWPYWVTRAGTHDNKVSNGCKGWEPRNKSHPKSAESRARRSQMHSSSDTQYNLWAVNKYQGLLLPLSSFTPTCATFPHLLPTHSPPPRLLPFPLNKRRNLFVPLSFTLSLSLQ